jgi:uncharacterized protein (DUF488 family)
MDKFRVYSIGHGDRSVEDLIEVLAEQGIRTLVDIRADPHSRRHPQFNDEALRAALEAAGIIYHWAGRQLGGRREPRADSRHVGLKDDGLRGFADYMETPEFARGVAQLRNLAARAPTAMLCAEREPAQCHRSLVADWLTLQGVGVVHLIEPGGSREHLLSSQARRESAELVYDRTG